MTNTRDSDISPDDYLLHYYGGRELEQPMPLSQVLDSQYHQGLQEASQYDIHALREDKPLRQEGVAFLELQRTAEAISNAYLRDIIHERDMTRVKWQEMIGAREDLAVLEAREVESARQVENHLKEMDQPGSPDYVHQIRMKSDPQHKMRRIGWALIGLSIVGGVAEFGMNYIAALALRESSSTTFMFAAAISFAAITLPWLAGRALSEPHSRSKGLAWAALALLLLVLLGLGWLRYFYTYNQLVSGLAKQNQPPPPLIGGLAIGLLSVTIPLALSVVVLLKVLQDKHQQIYQMWFNRRELAELRQQIADTRESLKGRTRSYQDAIHFGDRIRQQAVTAILSHKGVMFQAVQRYFDGLAAGLSDPACTAVLDERYEAFRQQGATEADQIVEGAIGRLIPEPVWAPEEDTEVSVASSIGPLTNGLDHV